ncbi:MAG: hypothetical protein FWD15_02675 [Alphaproteobacteria bacterium]|nr:hypothetical protein [Alphaproteobacteria bacterium]
MKLGVQRIVGFLHIGEVRTRMSAVAFEGDKKYTMLAVESIRNEPGAFAALDEEKLSSVVNILSDKIEKKINRRIYDVIIIAANVSAESDEIYHKMKLNPRRAITAKNVEKAFRAALLNASIDEGREMLHVVPTGYILDGERIIGNPIGMSARDFEVLAVSVIADSDRLAFLKRVARLAHLNPILTTFGAFGALTAVPKEKLRAGALFIEIGSISTIVAFFANGSIAGVFETDRGGHFITEKIAADLGIDYKDAERFKITHGAEARHGDAFENLEVLGDGVGEESIRRIPKREFVRVAAEALSEFLGDLKSQIEKHEICGFAKSIHFAGWTSFMKGFKKIAAETFTDRPVAIIPEAEELSEDEKGNPELFGAIEQYMEKSAEFIEPQGFDLEFAHSFIGKIKSGFAGIKKILGSKK